MCDKSDEYDYRQGAIFRGEIFKIEARIPFPEPYELITLNESNYEEKKTFMD